MRVLGYQRCYWSVCDVVAVAEVVVEVSAETVEKMGSVVEVAVVVVAAAATVVE